MQNSLILVAIVGITIFVVMRIRVLEEKLGMLRRAMDRQLGEQDVEFMVKTIRETTADALEARLGLVAAPLQQQSVRLTGGTAVGTSTEPAE